jgi:hypothetical protein
LTPPPISLSLSPRLSYGAGRWQRKGQSTRSGSALSVISHLLFVYSRKEDSSATKTLYLVETRFP